MTSETPNLHVSKNFNISKMKNKYRETENAIRPKKKYVCFLFHPVKSLGRVGRLSFFFLTFFIT